MPGDGLIERELSELASARREQAKQETFEVWIWTSDVRAAGTDSNVSLQVRGFEGTRVTSHCFSVSFVLKSCSN